MLSSEEGLLYNMFGQNFKFSVVQLAFFVGEAWALDCGILLKFKSIECESKKVYLHNLIIPLCRRHCMLPGPQHSLPSEEKDIFVCLFLLYTKPIPPHRGGYLSVTTTVTQIFELIRTTLARL